MNATQHIVCIQDLLDQWRAMGRQLLRNGVELIGQLPIDDQVAWLHVVFPPLSADGIEVLDRELGVPLPSGLRALLRCCGGMSLFSGAFHLAGRRRPGVAVGDGALQPFDLVALNHEIDVIGWKPKHAVAFAQNSWDLTVHVTGMAEQPEGVVRCERQTGRIIEQHDDVFACIAARLSRLDELQLR
ncbi:MAG: SMI1/KNR4 family protein [Planctomycetes bacterium]|jgi:hypothetical protein|nr:SMI1/KNR4 family protein [Planctomycetota bacterium]